MRLPRLSLFATGALSLLCCATRAAAADLELPRFVPAETPLVLHVRSLSELRANWQHTPFARTWNEPDVQKFFAPGRQKFQEEIAAEFSNDVLRELDLTPQQIWEMFNGEFLVAIGGFEAVIAEEAEAPTFLVAVQLTGNREKVEQLLAAGEKKRAVPSVEEEFQGEKITVRMKAGEDGAAPTAEDAFAIVEDTLLIGVSRESLQQAIACRKRDDRAQSVAGAPQFAQIFQRTPDTHVTLYLGFETFVPALMKVLDQKQESGEGGVQALGGMPASLLVRALGLDALRSMHLTMKVGQDATELETAISWFEQRGLLRLLAYGEAPAPQPGFVPDTWLSVSSARYDLGAAYRGIMDTLRDSLPMIEGMVRQQIVNLNQNLQIDLERDFIGSVGDEVLNAHAAPVGTPANQFQATEQLVAFSLRNADAFTRAVDALMNLSPGMGAAIQRREYLGETIRSFSPPAGEDAPQSARASFAITRSHLLINIGGTSMLETAIQGLDGAKNSLWSRPEVQAALAELPSGASMLEYTDLRRFVPLVMTTLNKVLPTVVAADDAKEEEDEDDVKLRELVDPEAVPPAESLEKHWSTMASGGYREANGLRGRVRLKHVP